MQKTVLCLVLIYISASMIHGTGADVNSLCGDDNWITYKDEKCLRLFETFETRNRADEVCSQHGSTLVTIKSADEQKFLTEYILKSSDSRSIWIGAARRLDSSTEFEWNDGSAVQRFTNWAIGRPSDDVRRTCVNMVPSILLGTLSELQWFDTGCTAANWFICEKLQTWPFHIFQQAILSLRRELDHSVEKLNSQSTQLNLQTTQLNLQATQLNSATTQLRVLQDNPIPIGFIYVQLPNQPEPRTIWSSVGWTDVSSQYAGLFFRVSGGNSAAFGTIQAENSPRLTDVVSGNFCCTIRGSTTIPASNNFSPIISSGALIDSGVTSSRALQFLQSSGEVRPRNHAVRIWRRAT